MSIFGDGLFGDGFFGDFGGGPITTPVGTPVRPQTFTVFTADLFTDEIIEELPHRNLRFRNKYKKAGEGSFLLELGDNELSTKDVIDATRPAQTAMYIDYNGTLVWGGPIWNRQYSGRSSTLSIDAKEWISFWERQFIDTVVGTLRFNNVDQLSIFRQIIATVTARTGGDVGLNVDNTVMSGVLRDRTYFDYEHKNVFEALFQLSEVINGFDFRILVEWSGDRPRKRLSLGYPDLGSHFPENNLLFDFPGNILDYDYPEDGDSFLTGTHAIGKGEGVNMLHTHSTDLVSIAGGYPLLEDVYSYKDISKIATLQEHAQADLFFRGILTKSFTIRLSYDDPLIGTFALGDRCRVDITDPRFPEPPAGGPGLSVQARILDIQVSAEEGLTLEIGEVWER